MIGGIEGLILGQVRAAVDRLSDDDELVVRVQHIIEGLTDRVADRMADRISDRIAENLMASHRDAGGIEDE